MDANSLYYTMSTIAQVAATGFAMSAAVAMAGMQYVDRESDRTKEILLLHAKHLGLRGVEDWIPRLRYGELEQFFDWFNTQTGGRSNEHGTSVMMAAAFVGEQQTARRLVEAWLKRAGMTTTISVVLSLFTLPQVPSFVQGPSWAANSWTGIVLVVTSWAVICYMRLTRAAIWPEPSGAAADKVRRWAEKAAARVQPPSSQNSP